MAVADGCVGTPVRHLNTTRVEARVMSAEQHTPEVEEWRPVVGYEGLYEVSSFGRVKSVLRRVAWQGTLTTVRERILSLCDSGNGYRYVILCKGGRRTRKNFHVHRLVLEAFVGPPPENADCRHFPDPDRANNRLENLQWGTRLENMRDKYAHRTHLYGDRSPKAKLTDAQALEILRLHRTGQYYQREIASKLGIRQSLVSAVVNGKTYGYLDTGLPNMPSCLFIRGEPGVGKITVAKILERDLGWKVVWLHRFDVVYDVVGGDPCPKLMDDVLLPVVRNILQAGKNVIFVRPARGRESVESVRQLTREMGCSFVLVRLAAKYETLVQRVSSRPPTPFRIKTPAELDAYRNARPLDRLMGEHVIDTDSLTPEEVATKIRGLLP